MSNYDYINLFKIATNRDVSRDVELVTTLRDVATNITINVTKRRDKFDVVTNVMICRDLKQINIIII